MQGRQGRGEGPMDRPSEPRLPSMNGTSKQRAIPQRPPGMVRLETPPEVPRVPRPEREQLRPGSLRNRLLALCAVLAIAAVIAGVVGYFWGLGLTNSSGPATVAGDFLLSISNTDYKQAYTDLGPAITISPLMTPEKFTAQAEALDRCYGTVKTYSEVMDSATNQDNIQSYTYTITRSKLSQPYQLKIRLQQSSDDSKWKIIDYGSTLGPSQHAPACNK